MLLKSAAKLKLSPASIAVSFTQVPELFQLGTTKSTPESSAARLLSVTADPATVLLADIAPMVGPAQSIGPVHAVDATTLSENMSTGNDPPGTYPPKNTVCMGRSSFIIFVKFIVGAFSSMSTRSSAIQTATCPVPFPDLTMISM